MSVRNERGMAEKERERERGRPGSNASTGFVVQEEALQRGTPARELEPTAAYRLGVDVGEQSGGNPTRWVNSGVESTITWGS
jgi:hypothetical protein